MLFDPKKLKMQLLQKQREDDAAKALGNGDSIPTDNSHPSSNGEMYCLVPVISILKLLD